MGSLKFLLLLLGFFGWLVVWCIVQYLIPGGLDPSGVLQIVVALMVTAGLLSLPRSWRPLVASAVGTIVAGAAWFTAYLADFSTPASASISIATMFGTGALALVYILVFRTLGKNQTKSEQEEAARAERQASFKEIELIVRRVVIEELAVHRAEA